MALQTVKDYQKEVARLQALANQGQRSLTEWIEDARRAGVCDDFLVSEAETDFCKSVVISDGVTNAIEALVRDAARTWGLSFEAANDRLFNGA